MSVGLNYNTYSELLNLINQSGKNYDLNVIDKAYQAAYKAHYGQKRISGVDYILHPVSVAYILVELGMDTPSIAAALLHDVVEDTELTQKDIRDMFGEEISVLVDGVTKLKKIPSSSREEQQAENIRKMLLAMSHDIRVIMIKLADRLQNMRTIECMDIQKRRDKSLQNMEVFAPIAHRLGIRTIKDELEDISLKCLDPIAYAEIENSLALREEDREKFINLIKKRLMDRLQKFIPDVYIEGRVKSANEIYKKIFIKGKSMDQIYDIYAVRVIVNTVNDCYNVFGIVHDMFQPIPSRFKDYISIPKPNLYQSLHTTVLSKEGIPFEIQIRTWEMHRTAEYGIAAHWKYKLGITEKDDSMTESLSWVRKLLDNHRDVEDVTDVIGNIKSDLVPKEIFILTPKGDVISLPTGSTVIDFAYAIHTELGNHMIGAKVNKKIVPLNYVLKTGEIVDIISTKDSKKGPGRDWLGIVKTSEARNKIRQWFKRERREENIVEGKAETELEFKKNKIFISENKFSEFLTPVMRKNQCATLEDFFAAVGYGGIQLWRIMPRLKNEYMKKNRDSINSLNLQNQPAIIPEHHREVHTNKKSLGIIVEDMQNCFVKMARCCNPLPGDNIVGFITKGYGVSVHRCDCKNVPENPYENDDSKRWVHVSWDDKIVSTFDTSIEIKACDREELLTDITRKISAMNLKVKSFNSKAIPDNKIEIFINLNVKNLEHLRFITNNLARISGVSSVKRV